LNFGSQAKAENAEQGKATSSESDQAERRVAEHRERESQAKAENAEQGKATSRESNRAERRAAEHREQESQAKEDELNVNHLVREVRFGVCPRDI